MSLRRRHAAIGIGATVGWTDKPWGSFSHLPDARILHLAPRRVASRLDFGEQHFGTRAFLRKPPQRSIDANVVLVGVDSRHSIAGDEPQAHAPWQVDRPIDTKIEKDPAKRLFGLWFLLRVHDLALPEYLVSISPDDPSPALSTTWVETVADVFRSDAQRGQEVYGVVYARCHGQVHTGAGRAADFVSVVPDESVEFANRIGVASALVMIEKVRHGGFFTVGGVMAPFSRGALSDEDLGALLALFEL